MMKAWIKKTDVINLIAFFTFVIGVFCFFTFNKTLIPELSFKSIEVKVNYPEAALGDLERYIVFPLEKEFLEISHMRTVSSTIRKGEVKFNLQFYDSVSDMGRSLIDVQKIIAQYRLRLPQGIRDISAEIHEKKSSFLMSYYVKGFDPLNPKHQSFLASVEEKIKSVSGIVSTNFNAPRPEVLIEVKKSKLTQLRLSLKNLLQNLKSQLAYSPLGSDENLGVKTFYEYKPNLDEDHLMDLKNIPIKTNRLGYSTELGDVADIKYGHATKRWGRNFIDNKEAYWMGIFKNIDSDIVELDARLNTAVKEIFSNDLGIEFQASTTGKSFLVRQLDVIRSNGLIGLFLIFLIVLLFINFKASLCVLLGLPVAYAGTAIFMMLFGVELDLLTVVGLIIVSGMLVDDALIVTEKYMNLLEQGLSPLESAHQSIKTLFWPVFGTVMTTIVAFSPLILIPSSLGELLKPIPLVVIAALIVSLIESFLILPNHLQHFVKKPKPGRLSGVFRYLEFKYTFVLQLLMRWRYPWVILICALTFFGVNYVKNMPQNFNLNISSVNVILQGELSQSKSIEDSKSQMAELLKKIEGEFLTSKYINEIILGVNAILDEGEWKQGQRFVRVSVKIDEVHSNPTQFAAKVENRLKEFIKDEPKSKYKKIYTYVGNAYNQRNHKKYLEFRVYSKKSKVPEELFEEIKKAMPQTPALGEPLSADKSRHTSWTLQPQAGRLSELNFSKKDISYQLQSQVSGIWLQDFWMNGGFRPLKFKLISNDSKNNPNEMTFLTDDGREMSFSSLGEWSKVQTPDKINHLMGYRLDTLKYPFEDLSQRNSLVKKAREITEKLSKKYSEFRILASGETLTEAESREWLLNVLLFCLLGIYFILALTLGGLLQPFVVILPIPFTVVSIMIVHMLHGLELGVMSMVGIVGTIGVAVNGSLIMASEINQKIQSKYKKLTSLDIQAGARSRFRPLVLTAITTLLGLFPMAYGIGGDSGYTKPVALTLAWGILISALFTLFVFPAILKILEDINILKK